MANNTEPALYEAEPGVSTANTSNAEEPTPVTLNNVERFYKWRTEQVAVAFQNEDLERVFQVAHELLLHENLPLLFRAMCNFYLAGAYRAHREPITANGFLDECIHYCHVMIDIAVEKNELPKRNTTLLLEHALNALEFVKRDIQLQDTEEVEEAKKAEDMSRAKPSTTGSPLTKEDGSPTEYSTSSAEIDLESLRPKHTPETTASPEINPAISFETSGGEEDGESQVTMDQDGEDTVIDKE